MHLLATFCCVAVLAAKVAHADAVPTSAPQIRHCDGFQVVYSAEVSSEPEWIESLCDYYEAQEAGNWEATYQRRPASFRKLVPFDVYAREMSERRPTLKLTVLELESVQRTKLATFQLRVSFIRTRNGTLDEARDPSQRHYSMSELVEWENDGNSWGCAACGEDTIFSVNSRMVYD